MTLDQLNYTYNQLNQPIGRPVPDWAAPPLPDQTPLIGRYCRLEGLTVDRHADDLFAAYSLDRTGPMWTYLGYGPFPNLAALQAWMASVERSTDPLFYAIIDLASGKAVGHISYLRIAPAAGSIEVGHVVYSPLLQRTRAATEAMYLLMQRVFTLGYRRYEWKCDALNAPSRQAAQRYGFSYEGIFRQALVYKGRNRDTAWYACVDHEWPALDAAYQQWLDPANFDQQGQQRRSLSALTAPILATRG